MAAKQVLIVQCSAAAASAQQVAAALQRDVAGKLEKVCAAQAEEGKANLEVSKAQSILQAAQQNASSKHTLTVNVVQDAADAQSRTDTANRLASEARDKIFAAQEDLGKFTAALLPLKRSLDHMAADSAGSEGGTSDSKRGRPEDHASLRIFTVKSNDLVHVLAHMLHDSGPAVYDLQGKEMEYTSEENTTIPAGVTWRNGSITLRPSTKLYVDSPDVVFENIKLRGGKIGVCVRSGGSLTMTACEIRSCNTGVSMVGGGLLQASGLKLVDCDRFGFFLSGNSTAKLLGGEFTGNATGIYMMGNSSFLGTAMQMTGTAGHMIRLCDKAKLSLSGCNITLNPGEDPGDPPGESAGEHAVEQPGDVLGHLSSQVTLVMSTCVVNGELFV